MKTKELVIFKAGDKVYCPTLGNAIFTIESSVLERFPLKVETDTNLISFTQEGNVFIEHAVPSIFKATKENQELLSKLYGIQFEEPKSFLDHHLSLGSKVLCLVVNEPRELPEKIWGIDNNNEFIYLITKKLGNHYYSSNNTAIRWNHVFPIAIDNKGNITYLN